MVNTLTKLFLVLVLQLPISLIAQSNETEQAAMKSIVGEMLTFYRSNSFAEVVKKYWVMDDATFLCLAEGDGKVVFLKKDELLGLTLANEDDKSTVEQSGFSFIIEGNVANMYLHQKIYIPEVDTSILSHESWVWKKINGTWKVNNMTIVRYTPKG